MNEVTVATSVARVLINKLLILFHIFKIGDKTQNSAAIYVDEVAASDTHKKKCTLCYANCIEKTGTH